MAGSFRCRTYLEIVSNSSSRSCRQQMGCRAANRSGAPPQTQQTGANFVPSLKTVPPVHTPAAGRPPARSTAGPGNRADRGLGTQEAVDTNWVRLETRFGLPERRGGAELESGSSFGPKSVAATNQAAPSDVNPHRVSAGWLICPVAKRTPIDGRVAKMQRFGTLPIPAWTWSRRASANRVGLL